MSAEIKIAPIQKGGSDRKFYRIRCSAEQALILVKYNLEREENRHYVTIANFLTEHRIRVPEIYFHDADEGLIWLEDLGERDLYSYRDESWLVRRAFYESALDQIAALHALPESVCIEMKQHLPAEFNSELYLWEQNYFFENCLGRLFKIEKEKLAQLASLPALQEIADRLASFPRVLVHRDFQSQNIIIRNGQAHLIDFQGMRPGLAEYDLASLLYDPYVDLPEERTRRVDRILSRASARKRYRDQRRFRSQVAALRHATPDASVRCLRISRLGQGSQTFPQARRCRDAVVAACRSGNRRADRTGENVAATDVTSWELFHHNSAERRLATAVEDAVLGGGSWF